MSKELIKQKLIEHLNLYGFEYAWFEDETGDIAFLDLVRYTRKGTALPCPYT
ncbi:MAG: hypothetical protein V7K97_03240 [Nostoc sp.]|uniref:hypothetical protein n=1 Tax=Nostoc sp. TaxID=1180 RepID=UPI002FF4C882